MTEFVMGIGVIAVVIGGILVCACILGLFGYLACQAWVAFSNRFRDICRAENVIRDYSDYLAHKEEFAEWKKGKKWRF